jgi:hypothetical protein
MGQVWSTTTALLDPDERFFTLQHNQLQHCVAHKPKKKWDLAGVCTSKDQTFPRVFSLFAVKESPVALLKAITTLPETALYHPEQFQMEEAQHYSSIIFVVLDSLRWSSHSLHVRK